MREKNNNNFYKRIVPTVTPAVQKQLIGVNQWFKEVLTHENKKMGILKNIYTHISEFLQI